LIAVAVDGCAAAAPSTGVAMLVVPAASVRSADWTAVSD
jgi:hypothetical protein